MRRSYSPAAHSKILLKSGYAPPSGSGAVYILDAWMTHGNGYLAGEFPGGTTTVEGVPQSATVRILYRPAAGTPGDGVLVAEVQSAPDGTWRVDGLNPDLRYDVVGRLEGRNDVIMAGVSPMRTDIVTYEDELVPKEGFDGMDGYILLLDGLPPFAVSGTQGMPAGLFTVVDGRKLIIDGATNEAGEWEAGITVQDANSNTLTIPVLIPIGFDAPSDLASSYDEAENTITITWTSNSHVEEAFYIYRSDTQLDPDDLPPPIGSVGKGVTEFVDDTVVFEAAYYYAVAAVHADRSKMSEQTIAFATSLSFDSFMTELAPISWWKMQELSGVTAVDESGLKNGQYQGSPTLGAPALRRGSEGSVGFLSGSQQCYVGPGEAYGSLFGSGRNATIAFWYKHVASNGQNRVMQYFITPAGGNTVWRIYPWSFQTPDNSTKLVIPAKMVDGDPHFIVIVRDSIGYKLYVDGVLEDENPTVAAAGGISGSYGLTFPGAGGYSHYPVRCYMSDVAMFDKAISGEDVAKLYMVGEIS